MIKKGWHENKELDGHELGGPRRWRKRNRKRRRKKRTLTTTSKTATTTRRKRKMRDEMVSRYITQHFTERKRDED